MVWPNAKLSFGGWFLKLESSLVSSTLILDDVMDLAALAPSRSRWREEAC